MYMQQSIVKCESGLYNRQATYFIQKANEFKSSIWVEVEDRKINAKSLLGVLSMGITKGTRVSIIAEGPDEERSSKSADRHARKRGLLSIFLHPEPTGGALPSCPCNNLICWRCVRSAFLFRSYDI